MPEPLPIRYRLANGRPVISVTQVLSLAGRIDTQWFTEESRERGSLVHRLTESFDRREDVLVPPAVMGYMEAYQMFLSVVRPIYSASELAVTSDDDALGGCIDRVCLSLFGEPGILDFKTGPPAPWHALQLAAYNALRPTGARWACYLQPNGRYKLKQYDDPMDHRKFVYDLEKVAGTVTPDGDVWRWR